MARIPAESEPEFEFKGAESCSFRRSPPPSVMSRSLRLFLAVLLALSFFADVSKGSSQQLRQSREAYASLLYSDAFLLGLRVLGQSLRETGTSRCALQSRGALPNHHP